MDYHTTGLVEKVSGKREKMNGSLIFSFRVVLHSMALDCTKMRVARVQHDNRPVSYSNSWTGSSMKWRLMRAN